MKRGQALLSLLTVALEEYVILIKAYQPTQTAEQKGRQLGATKMSSKAKLR